ncbi:hypothetical protein AGABI2DRAFT_136660 [Agaricus bisporus var. bisporus H97]|uniref:hypothetical protein n=1 Tax=Agaricus bisporus var. bisporus (strain H97 / ATCC MYA-4626 / FGSC 10389) TaxID=936046 RepID=UPI00029F7710|nr:hypothetical protein AGABI2DRAFT_136660 [Agaricus bisporus var. bisporus H97]EKV46411.1 hypothetical protein AGABI2DRAFT_136660 [Agaricus bisporus var. bisporus H97]
MKQGKLKFASSKHTASASGAKKGLAKSKSVVRSNAEGTADIKEEAKKISIKPRSSSNSSLLEPTKSDTNDQPSLEPLPHLNIKDPRWRKLFADAKAKRNRQPLIHCTGQNEVHQILRVFDLNYDYGPCIGVTRLERWERAQAMGLNPPLEIRDILLTSEGVADESYSECVFYGEV